MADAHVVFFSNVFSNVLSSHLAHLAQDFSRCIDATWCNILRNLLNRCKKENLAGFQLDASSSCGALCLQRWDLGNYYTVGGSGRVIPKDPVPVSQCLNGIRWHPMATFFDISRVMATFQRVSAYALIFSAPGHLNWHFQGDGHVSACFSNMHRFLVHLGSPGTGWLINCCRSILEGIQDACKFANCKVHSDLSDDAEVFTSVHRNMFSQGFIQDMLH